MPSVKNADNRISSWYQQYRDHLSHFAMRLGFQHCEAEDLINQLFLELWEKQTDLSNIEQPKSFLLTALKRRIIDQHRKKKNSLFIVTDKAEPADSEQGKQSLLEELEDQQQSIKELGRTYASLPKRLQEIVYLKFYKGLPTNTIAESLGISNRTVYNSLFEAIKLLRSRFTKKN
jgi:RNA polymerase sigma-70 factor (ECF subfamily)